MAAQAAPAGVTHTRGYWVQARLGGADLEERLMVLAHAAGGWVSSRQLASGLPPKRYIWCRGERPSVCSHMGCEQRSLPHDSGDVTAALRRLAKARLVEMGRPDRTKEAYGSLWWRDTSLPPPDPADLDAERVLAALLRAAPCPPDRLNSYSKGVAKARAYRKLALAHPEEVARLWAQECGDMVQEDRRHLKG